jgi:predicted molibdopterin-dependent oxidoreductase YjgC
MTILIDGSPNDARQGERLIDVIGRVGVELPHVCYHPQLGPIQTCDTCLVELDGNLVRACATAVSQDMAVQTTTDRAHSARTEAFDRILTNHLLYCKVCDNDNGNCVVHNTAKLLAVEHQSRPFKLQPYEVDNTNPFYLYDPNQCILCGRCVEACQNLQVNETHVALFKIHRPGARRSYVKQASPGNSMILTSFIHNVLSTCCNPPPTTSKTRVIPTWCFSRCSRAPIIRTFRSASGWRTHRISW